MEKLEDRNLMAADWNPTVVANTGFFLDEAGRTAGINYVNSKGVNTGGDSYQAGAEGDGPTLTTISEIEPNNSFGTAQPLPLNSSTTVSLLGNNTTPLDEDWFAFNLNAGDIFDVRLNSNAALFLPMMSLYNSANAELASTQTPFVGIFPPNSGLSGSATAPIGTAGLHYVIPTSGRYYFRLSDVLSTYTLTMNAYRPPMESQPAGTKQILFLDFDGAIVARNTFGFGPGSGRLSAFTRSLAGWNLLPSDEPLLIQEITQRVQNKFEFLGRNTTNPNFAIEVLNSKQVSVDPWGSPNVSRMIVGGTFQELTGLPTNPIGLIGIAQSVDPGNYNTTESALVMMDVLIASSASGIPLAGNSTQIQFVAEVIAGVIAHEAGHYFGGWHQDPASAGNFIMDQFYAPDVFAGVGRDGVFGTVDDTPLQFGVDDFANPGAGPFLIGGINDTLSFLGWGLTGGQVGGRIAGNVFNDRNLSRTKDAGDTPLSSVRVYTDLNNNSVFDSGEFSAVSDSAGNYSILVRPGTYNVREVVPSGFRLTTPVTGSVAVTVTGTNTVSNVNFGQEQINLNATGVKWNDANGNGLRDPGEGIIAGVRMYLDIDGDRRIDIGEPSAKTNDQGQYTLTFPGPGTYRVREVVEPGYVQTYPTAANNYEHTVVVTGNAAVDAVNMAGLNFGNKLTVDFGDAPVSYGEASAGFTPGLLLGANWDDEQSSQYSSTGLGDDANGKLDANDTVIDDEDGIVFTRPLVRGNTSNRIAVTAANTTGASAYLNAWIDFNQDGDFADAGERVISNSTVASGTSVITFAAPSTALLGNTFARFRYSSERDVPATGRSLTGEVEDYLVSVVATLELAADDRFSVTRNSVLNPLDVLANDFALPGEQLEILNTSGSSAGGIVQVSASNQILYTPPAGFIGQDTFSYTMRNASGETDTASVTVDVQLFFENPVAVDDSFDIALNAIDSPLNVLANDIEGQAGALTIIMITQPSGGGQVSISSGGKALRYTPVRGFNSTETFTYTVADANGNQSTAKVTLHILPYVNETTDVVYSLRTTDLAGNPITAIPQGQDFKLEIFVDDFRNDRGGVFTAPGVFSAYMDLLYNLQLVSTAIPDAGSALNFDADFFNSYTNGISGDATIPGIIDEFGAFNSTGNNADPGSMNFPDTVRLATVTFTARSPGIAKFTPDPADVSPLNDTLLFDVAGSAVPVERIRFLGTSLEIVGNSAEFPFAVDDSLTLAIPAGSNKFPINVKANDLPGSTGIISVISASPGQNGSTQVDAQGRVLYTPNGGFAGTDQFTYTISDARGITSQAQVTVRVGAADTNDIVELRLEVTDLNGTPITDIAVGGQFQLRGYAKDLRTGGVNRGVFAAYQDVLYSSGLVSPKASNSNPLGFEIGFPGNYGQVINGDTNNKGIINEVGAVQNGNSPLGSSEQLMFVVTLDAKAVGTATFIGDPADIKPLHDTLTFDPAAVVGIDLLRFGSDTLNITSSGSLGGGEFTNLRDRHDVNADGSVSPIDALIVINHLNAGSRALSGGEGENDGRYYIDVNGDLSLSPIDALLVINRLNASRGGVGEGEGGAELIQFLSAGALVPSNSAPNTASEAPSPVAEVLTSSPKSAIGSRDTHTLYGPSFVDSTSSATDSVFDEDESGLDELLAQLAPDIEESRKKR